jgi:multidrug transporter EmrE-like cation transporter
MAFSQVLIFLTIGVLLAFGDFSMKYWSGKDGNFFGLHAIWYYTAIFLYIVGLSIYGYRLRFVDFAAASYGILLFNMIVVAIAGYTFFGDRMSLLEFAGILLGLSSIVAFSLSRV